jgi:hypothetical protein
LILSYQQCKLQGFSKSWRKEARKATPGLDFSLAPTRPGLSRARNVYLALATKKPRHGIAVMAGLSNAIWVEQRSWRAGWREPSGEHRKEVSYQARFRCRSSRYPPYHRQTIGCRTRVGAQSCIIKVGHKGSQ